ncbi:MAG: prealbumin-like fold domain-containing protein [Planctomycetaceae bacterium]|nr:prealbumin-like fold domain-containing protein [Planctomycetaceae bacterium]
MNRTLVLSIVLLLAAFLMTGCGEKLPDGMPRLYPASVAITQEGTPLAGAVVQLFPVNEANAAWGPGGTTDESGVVVLQTNGRYKGVPLGEYKVTVTKNEREPHPNPELRDGAEPEVRRYIAISQTLKTYSFVESEYGLLTQTPLRLEITAGERNYTIDAGKIIKEETRTMQ